MVKLNIRMTTGNKSAAILADGKVIGGITMTDKETYTINTNGNISDIDGLSDTSIKKVWERAKMQNRYGSEVIDQSDIEGEDKQVPQPNDDDHNIT
ncbi:hypothetical protein [Komagataeibacter nataicola]|uniref:hypothetical protein n=1 Tax=Komagataeibacter nataicola TaxID=265960 RepID=UPI0011B47BB3|nr:hypothetical protein [Komagataeibacter nataicola]WNM09459.1 hypothetical protein RI056_05750 [Komagataeibacter nataicola]GBR26668.1 hypothetical protein AA0616_3274 [Komagataeibacter nataicola NRIC 0616]